jgi:hypothetical protein
MNVKFKIIETDLSQHSMVVRYYTDYFTEDNLASSFITGSSGEQTIDRRPDGSPIRCVTDCNINIWQTEPPPTEEDLISIAKQSAPYSWFKLRYDVLNPNVDTSLSAVNSLLGKEFIAEEPAPIVKPETKEISEDHIEALIRELTSNTA